LDRFFFLDRNPFPSKCKIWRGDKSNQIWTYFLAVAHRVQRPTNGLCKHLISLQTSPQAKVEALNLHARAGKVFLPLLLTGNASGVVSADITYFGE
jgi:hypothetical protein